MASMKVGNSRYPHYSKEKRKIIRALKLLNGAHKAMNSLQHVS